MRIDGKGIIDRSQPVSFRFGDRGVPAFRGDSVASALIANDIRLVGRSFKYHRPRGIFGAGSEEPNALVTWNDAPNLRATMIEAEEGAVIRPQNAWPALNFDMLAVNDFLSPFFASGFYYKTFMWPRSFWEKVYEPAIRRAAGLGKLSGKPDTDPYEKVWAHCDLLVIGAGPAGLMAALTAGRAGADVILADEDWLMGGRLNGEDMGVEEVDAHLWAARVVGELDAMPNVRLMPRTTVTGAFDGGTYGALERVSTSGDAPREAFWRIVAKRAVLAAGAIERPIAFPMNDRPGVMLASAVRTYLNRYGVAPGQRIVVFANNDDAYRTAFDLVSAGVEVAALIDPRPDAQPNETFPVYAGAEVVATTGRLALNSVTIRHAGGMERIMCDCLAVSGGWNPTLHLTSHMGARPVWDEELATLVPGEAGVPGLVPAGAAAGIFSTHGALASGLSAAKAALGDLGLKAPDVAVPQAEDAPVRLTPHWQVTGARGRAWVDLSNDVTAKDLTLAVSEGFASPEHAKRYTTQGMAPDQGRTSNVNTIALLSGATGKALAETGVTTYRPPFSPVSIGAQGAGGAGKGFAPTRLIPAHAAMKHAPMTEAGLWYRPLFYRQPGEGTWRQSCDREVMTVRGAVGVADVSTLGKIDVKGPDAAAFLDFIYTGTMTRLVPGQMRYGVMLREDGFVMDDGTVARLADDHFVLSTTTGAAGAVMDHMTFAAQVLRPGMEVALTSVTDHWAQYAVTGPKARDLVAGLSGADVASLAHMHMMEADILGVPGRIFRLSFSGELGFEVAVPARFGEDLWEHLTARAAALGGAPYGMEAMNVLRIEKGFLTHAEIDGRRTARDLGLGWALSTKKDYIGRAGATRPALVAEGRAELVGLEPAAPVKLLTSGGLLFEEGQPTTTEHMAGQVTSACFSPTLGRTHALALVTNGRARIGEHLHFLDAVREVETRVRIVPACAYDPDGGRMNG